MEAREQEHLTLRDYLAPVAARRWMVLGLTALAFVASFAYYSRQDETFMVSTKLYVAQEGDPLVGVGAGYSDDRTVENQATLLTSQDVARSVARRIKYTGSASSLAARVTAVPSSGSDFITIAAQGSTGAEAAAIANGFAQAFIDVRSGQRREAASTALAEQKRQLEALPSGEENAASRDQIAANIRQLEVALRSGPGNARQIDPAEPPASPTGRPAWQKAALAALAALIGSVMLAYMLHRLDPRLRGTEDAVEIYGRPTLGAIFEDPQIEAFEDGRPTLSPDSIEAFRLLRANLALAAPDRPFTTIIISSAEAGEGKSTVARNLSLVLREAGRSVALVDADLRKPSLPASLRVDRSEGLADVISGTRTLSEVSVELSHGDSSTGGSLTLIPAGATPPDPAVVLESGAFRSLLEELKARHDVVVIDTAPLGVVSDAIPLLGGSDALVMVMRSGTADRRSAVRAAQTISRVPGVNLVGLVVNGLTGAQAAAYGTGTYYGQSEPSRLGRLVGRT